MTYAPWTYTPRLPLPWYRQDRSVFLLAFSSPGEILPILQLLEPLPQVDSTGPCLISMFLPFGEPLGGTWVRSSFCVSTSKYQLSISWLERMHWGEAFTILVPCRSSPREEAFQAEGTTCAKPHHRRTNSTLNMKRKKGPSKHSSTNGSSGSRGYPEPWKCEAITHGSTQIVVIGVIQTQTCCCCHLGETYRRVSSKRSVAPQPTWH